MLTEKRTQKPSKPGIRYNFSFCMAKFLSQQQQTDKQSFHGSTWGSLKGMANSPRLQPLAGGGSEQTGAALELRREREESRAWRWSGVSGRDNYCAGGTVDGTRLRSLRRTDSYCLVPARLFHSCGSVR